MARRVETSGGRDFSGPARFLTRFASLRIYPYQRSADGKRLALVRGDAPSDLVLIREAEK